MGTVVVGLDGSEVSRAAFMAAVAEAELRGLDVRAVHVFSYPMTTIYQATMLDVGDLEESARKWIDSEISSLEEAHGGSFPVSVEPVVTMGHVGVELCLQAADAELLVLGSRGFGGVRGVLLGSVSTYCTHHLPSPLLIIPVSHPDTD